MESPGEFPRKRMMKPEEVKKWIEWANGDALRKAVAVIPSVDDGLVYVFARSELEIGDPTVVVLTPEHIAQLTATLTFGALAARRMSKMPVVPSSGGG